MYLSRWLYYFLRGQAAPNIAWCCRRFIHAIVNKHFCPHSILCTGAYYAKPCFLRSCAFNHSHEGSFLTDTLLVWCNTNIIITSFPFPCHCGSIFTSATFPISFISWIASCTSCSLFIHTSSDLQWYPSGKSSLSEIASPTCAGRCQGRST